MDAAAQSHGHASTAVSRAVDDLTADYERTARPLLMERIERLAATRELQFAEVEEILDALLITGVPVETGEHDALTVGVGLRDAALEEQAGSRFVLDDEQRCRALLDHPLLNAQTEVELGHTVAAGLSALAQISAGTPSLYAQEAVARGERAREKLVTHNLRLVWGWAARYGSMTGLPVTDLFQEGVMGLLRAVDKFDAGMGFRFSTYAVWWIRQAITRAVVDRGSVIRLPVHVHERVMKLNRASRLLWMEHGARPSLRKLADELAWDIEEVAFLQGLASLVPTSLDEPMDEGGDPLVETIASDRENPEVKYESEQLAERIRDAVDDLPPRMRAVIARRNGLGGKEPETLESVAQSFGLTRERIRQIENKALDILRKTVPSRLGMPPIKRVVKGIEVGDGEQKGEGEQHDA